MVSEENGMKFSCKGVNKSNVKVLQNLKKSKKATRCTLTLSASFTFNGGATNFNSNATVNFNNSNTGGRH